MSNILKWVDDKLEQSVFSCIIYYHLLLEVCALLVHAGNWSVGPAHMCSLTFCTPQHKPRGECVSQSAVMDNPLQWFIERVQLCSQNALLVCLFVSFIC